MYCQEGGIVNCGTVHGPRSPTRDGGAPRPLGQPAAINSTRGPELLNVATNGRYSSAYVDVDTLVRVGIASRHGFGEPSGRLLGVGHDLNRVDCIGSSRRDVETDERRFLRRQDVVEATP